MSAYRIISAEKANGIPVSLACELLDVKPEACVFLDDLGINLKPAKAMGMTTIKVLNAPQALTDLEAVVGFPLT